MAPTTLPGMKTATSPYGREVKTMGNPLKITELVGQLPGTYYVTRQSVHTPSAVRKAKRAIKKPSKTNLMVNRDCHLLRLYLIVTQAGKWNLFSQISGWKKICSHFIQ